MSTVARMPQTPPVHFLVPRKLTDTELAQAIRLDIEAELDAINLYQAHIDATDHPLAKQVLAHIRDEEREHASLFWALLRELDPRVADEDASAGIKLRLLGEGASKEAVEAAGEQPDAKRSTGPTLPSGFTVGPLRGSS